MYDEIEIDQFNASTDLAKEKYKIVVVVGIVHRIKYVLITISNDDDLYINNKLIKQKEKNYFILLY